MTNLVFDNEKSLEKVSIVVTEQSNIDSKQLESGNPKRFSGFKKRLDAHVYTGESIEDIIKKEELERKHLKEQQAEIEHKKIIEAYHQRWNEAVRKQFREYMHLTDDAEIPEFVGDLTIKHFCWIHNYTWKGVYEALWGKDE